MNKPKLTDGSKFGIDNAMAYKRGVVYNLVVRRNVLIWIGSLAEHSEGILWFVTEKYSWMFTNNPNPDISGFFMKDRYSYKRISWGV